MQQQKQMLQPAMAAQSQPDYAAAMPLYGQPQQYDTAAYQQAQQYGQPPYQPDRVRRRRGVRHAAAATDAGEMLQKSTDWLPLVIA